MQSTRRCDETELRTLGWELDASTPASRRPVCVMNGARIPEAVFLVLPKWDCPRRKRVRESAWHPPVPKKLELCMHTSVGFDVNGCQRQRRVREDEIFRNGGIRLQSEPWCRWEETPPSRKVEGGNSHDRSICQTSGLPRHRPATLSRPTRWLLLCQNAAA